MQHAKPVRYVTLDVFATHQFRGNPLAVITDASGLSESQMQQIAFEFGYAETSFILPAPDNRVAATVRIFTPLEEVPFAGHPTIGTAFVMATEATAGVLPDCDHFTLALKSGRVEAHLLKQGQETIGAKIRCPQSLHVYEERDSELLAKCLGIPSSAIRLDRVPASVASVGLPFAFVHLQDKNWLSKISLHQESFEKCSQIGTRTVDGFCICAFSIDREGDGTIDVTSRVVSPLAIPNEDPACGSAAAALSALLVKTVNQFPVTINISQGEFVGRSSEIAVELASPDDRPLVSGRCVLVSSGTLYVND